ncbi:MAG: malto-oligosyltrehalose trehalohydrolase [Planctomycetota bacterium]|nr:malto-oligosyltrehalose trehalohydrolase [Planctomycetaceae bacterium]MDQ3329201.1 malto-oligosyltrehalose trehalohydrolase [Planctomycetota bacterium]
MISIRHSELSPSIRNGRGAERRFHPVATRGNARDEGDHTGRWRPSLGAWIEGDGTRFRVWAPEQEQVEVVLYEHVLDGHGSYARNGRQEQVVPLERFHDGTWGGWIEGVGAGATYRYRLAAGAFPDPASRYQPEGVHCPSQVVDPRAFAWTDHDWRGVDHKDLVLYELHVGTFTQEGTFEGVARKLPYLAELGVTAIELMPVADFPGDRNWGYDGVDLFAPARCYGTPDDLRRLVDEAHAGGVAVFMDVVYNHLGPEGNYLPTFCPYYFSPEHENPWGKALNFDRERSMMVRRFFIENALHWVHEYHIDGLRLDATHAIIDDSGVQFVAELVARVRESVHGRRVYLIAEDHRNLSYMVRCEGEGGWGLDGVWADDFHHEVRVALAGDNEGYYADFDGSMTKLADTLNKGWLYSGQFSEHLNEHRGTDPQGIPPRRFVFCLQNHDQIGNRALGERLHHQIDPAMFRAASVLMLCSPATPLIFMGQEWAARTPFLYFTDHPEELGQLVTEGRRKEFRHFRLFADEAARESIPDPQSERTFLESRLDWSEPVRDPHMAMLWLYRTLLTLRRTEPAIRYAEVGSFEAFALSETTLLLRQDADIGPSLLAVIQMHGAGEVDLDGHPALEGLAFPRCQLVLTTEDPPFTTDPQPPQVDLVGRAPRITFIRPSAVLLRVLPDGDGLI